jgi:hypothetical protein
MVKPERGRAGAAMDALPVLNARATHPSTPLDDEIDPSSDVLEVLSQQLLLQTRRLKAAEAALADARRQGTQREALLRALVARLLRHGEALEAERATVRALNKRLSDFVCENSGDMPAVVSMRVAEEHAQGAALDAFAGAAAQQHISYPAAACLARATRQDTVSSGDHGNQQCTPAGGPSSGPSTPPRQQLVVEGLLSKAAAAPGGNAVTMAVAGRKRSAMEMASGSDYDGMAGAGAAAAAAAAVRPAKQNCLAAAEAVRAAPLRAPPSALSAARAAAASRLRMAVHLARCARTPAGLEVAATALRALASAPPLLLGLRQQSALTEALLRIVARSAISGDGAAPVGGAALAIALGALARNAAVSDADRTWLLANGAASAALRVLAAPRAASPGALRAAGGLLQALCADDPWLHTAALVVLLLDSVGAEDRQATRLAAAQALARQQWGENGGEAVAAAAALVVVAAPGSLGSGALLSCAPPVMCGVSVNPVVVLLHMIPTQTTHACPPTPTAAPCTTAHCRRRIQHHRGGGAA